MSTPRTPGQRGADWRNTSPPDPDDPETWPHWPLDDGQERPAYLDFGPALVLGGAGTGKTHVLLGRAIHLIRSGVFADTIVIIAPSAWAAQEMRVRLFPVIGCDPDGIDLYVGTLHDFCLTKFLRPYATSLAHLPDNFTIWTRGQSLTALARIVESDPQNQTARRRQADPSLPSLVLDWISANAHLNPRQRAPAPRDEWEGYAAAYRREKETQHSLDHTDLLVATRDALMEESDVRRWHGNYLTRHLLVDNFEDLGPLEYELIRLMSGPEQSVCVAMDPNQSVRRQGFVLSDAFDRFTGDYAEAAQCLLAINHRTSASVMASWRGLAKHSAMTGLVDDQQRALWAPNQRPDAIAVDGTPQDQYRRIAEDVRRLVDEGAFEPDQIAILARRRQSLLRIQPYLDAVGIPFTALGDFMGMSDFELQPVLAMLTLAVNPKNVWAFRKAGNRAPGPLHCDIGPRIVNDVRSAAERLDIDLIEAAVHVCADLPPDSTAHENLSHLIDLYHQLQEMMANGASSVVAMLELVHHQINGGDRASLPSSDDMTRLKAWARECDLTALIRANDPLDDEDDPAPVNVRYAILDFLDRMTIGIDIPRLPRADEVTSVPTRLPSNWRPPNPRGISLATISMAKGMEWRAVIVADAADHIIPGREADDDPAMMEVEQRLFYSAVTRAADWYALYWARRRDDGTAAIPCRFIEPLLG